MRADRAIWLVAALFAALLGYHLRVRLATSLPNFDPDDDTGYFHVEGAFQYRYAKMLAYGPPPPETDVVAQYPEGVRVGRDVNLLMERMTAWTHALAGSPRPRDAFHGFVLLWICGFSAVATLALYFLALQLSDDPPLSAACALAYAASWLACSITAGTYGFQSFALPLLAAALACAFVRGPAAALFTAMALVSWHFSRFFMATTWLALGWAALRADAEGRARIARAAAWLTLGALLAGLFPVNLETRFLFSPGFLLGPAVIAFCVLDKTRGPLVAGVLAGLSLLSRGAEAAAYGHVWGLLFDKLRLGLIKPEDPLRLSAEARLLWSGPFNSPDPGLLVFAFLPLGLAGVLRLLGRGRPESAEPRRATEALFAVYLVGSALVSRLTTPLVWFLCLLPAAAAPSGRPRKYALWLTVGLAFFEALKTLFPVSPLNPALMIAAAVTSGEERPTGSFSHEHELLAWLRRRGGGRPVAANFGVSASVLAYGESPVLIHPKFETAGVRGKTLEYLAALYGSEEDLEAYCRRYGAKLLLHSADAVLDETKDGSRYMAGKRALARDSAAFKLHFAPEKLSRFKLLFENEDYRVYAVGASTESVYKGERDPIYDLAQYSPAPRGDGTVGLDVKAVLARRRDARLRVALARMLLRMRRGEESLAAYDDAFSLWPATKDLKAERDRLEKALGAAASPRKGPRSSTTPSGKKGSS